MSDWLTSACIIKYWGEQVALSNFELPPTSTGLIGQSQAHLSGMNRYMSQLFSFWSGYFAENENFYPCNVSHIISNIKLRGKKSINIITCRENRCLNKTFSDWQLYSSCWGWIKHHFWHHHHYNQIMLWSDYPKTKLIKHLNDLVTLIWMQWILSYTHIISSRITHCHGKSCTSPFSMIRLRV